MSKRITLTEVERIKEKLDGRKPCMSSNKVVIKRSDREKCCDCCGYTIPNKAYCLHVNQLGIRARVADICEICVKEIAKKLRSLNLIKESKK